MNWDKIFSEAHLNSWPTASICIQNVKPGSGRNIFSEDKAEILAAAKKHGYEIISAKDAKVVSFFNPNKKGEWQPRTV
jgi:hypothetical protein